MWHGRLSRTRFLAGIASLLLVTGCQWGPGAMKLGHQEYSEALREILSEQMLLNLVRMRYSKLTMTTTECRKQKLVRESVRIALTNFEEQRRKGNSK